MNIFEARSICSPGMNFTSRPLGQRVGVFQGLMSVTSLLSRRCVVLSSVDEGPHNSHLNWLLASFWNQNLCRTFLPTHWVTGIEVAALSCFLFQLAKLKSQKLLHPPERRGRKHRRNPGSGRRLQSPGPRPLRRSLRPGSQWQPRRRRKPPAPPGPRQVRGAGRQAGPPRDLG